MLGYAAASPSASAVSIALWIVQSLLAVVFVGAGLLKLTKTPQQLGTQIPILGTLPNGTLKAIGLLEVLGAIGLIAPGLTSIGRGLTPLAALGLAVIMLSAAVAHARRDEMGDVPKNVVLFVLCAFVVWGRWGWLV